jgi:hypothetical protein
MVLFCVVGWPLVLHASDLGSEDDKQMAALVDQLQSGGDAAASTAAFKELRQTLVAAPSGTVGATQIRLCEALTVSNDALAIHRLALVLSAAPCEDAIVILANRLGSNPTPTLRMALCNSLHAIAGQRPNLSPAAVALALERLEGVSRNARLPGPVIESAIMATAAFGSAGFDQLMKLKLDATAPSKIQNVMYSALSETDDPRGLAVLRQAVTDASICDSRRAQAMYGLGQMFSRAASVGRTIDPVEWNACVGLLKPYLSDATPDRVFVSALKAVAQMVDMQGDIDLQKSVLNALDSNSAARREAALDVLCQHGGPLGSTLSATIQELAQADGSPDVRCAAAAVLDKNLALQTTPLPDTK